MRAKHLHFLSIHISFVDKTWVIAIWKSKNCETFVTVIMYIFYFRWHQLMCFMYLFSPCVFILVKPSVKKPDKLKLLTPFKSIGFCFSSFLDWYCLFQRFLLIWCIFAFICCLLKIKFFKVTQQYKNFFVVHQCINCILF